MHYTQCGSKNVGCQTTFDEHSFTSADDKHMSHFYFCNFIAIFVSINLVYYKFRCLHSRPRRTRASVRPAPRCRQSRTKRVARRTYSHTIRYTFIHNYLFGTKNSPRNARGIWRHFIVTLHSFQISLVMFIMYILHGRLIYLSVADSASNKRVSLSSPQYLPKYYKMLS